MTIFMQVEKKDMMFFESLHRNISFLQNYFNTDSKIPTLECLVSKGKGMYGDDYEQTLFERVLTDMFDVFKQSVLELVDIIVALVTNKERPYWLWEKNYIFNYFINFSKSTLFT